VTLPLPQLQLQKPSSPFSIPLLSILTPTPEGKVPDSLRETGRGLQLTEEDWNPFQLSILNLTISLKMFLSNIQAR
jgi:hypothetical protein